MKKNCKSFIGYLYEDYKIKPLDIMPPTSAFVKSYDGLIKWMYFLIQDDNLLKNIILFGIKSAVILKKEFDSEPVMKFMVMKL